MRSLQLLTIVYGEQYVKLFEKCCLRSLSLFHNSKSLFKAKATWNIFTNYEDMEHIRNLFDQNLSTIKVNIQGMDQLRKYTDPVQSALVWQIDQCLKTNDLFLMAPPDTFFSDKTIENLLKVQSKKGECVAVAHPRVHESFLNETLSANNEYLVQSAMKHAHRSWTDAEKHHEFNTTYMGGIEWQEIQSGLYAISHRLPTVYLIDFLPEDLEYFKLCISSGDFDHIWPSTLLTKKDDKRNIIINDRYKLIGSSDIAFICEITDKEKNIPPYESFFPKDGSFWRDKQIPQAHNQINNMFQVIFRATTNQRSY